MVTASALLIAALAAGAQDRLQPILERWHTGSEEERLGALREAAALRKELGAAALASFGDPPVPLSWTRGGDLIDLVARERILSWYGLIVPLLSNRDSALRTRALEELARRDLHGFSGPVVPLLKDPDSRVAWQAAFTLIQMEARERVPEIVPLLKDAESAVRPNVALALGRLGTREHGPLVAPFLDDADPEVAAAAVQVLGQLKAREFAGRVVRFLEASEPSHRQAAIAALAAMDARDRADKIADRLVDAETLVRWEAIRALGRLKAREYSGQIVAAVDDDGGLAPALEAMGALGLRELSPHILPSLTVADPGIRWRAVRALGGVDAKDDADRVAEMLKDEDSYVRLCALQALAAMGVRDHAGAMIELLRDEERDVCQGAAEEASLLATPAQVRSVVPLLADDDPVTAWSAIHLIVGAGAKDALPAIVARFSAYGGVNRDVVWAIGRLGGRDQRDRVAGALLDADVFVRLHAAFALSRLSDRTEELEVAERTSQGAAKLAAGFALVRLGRKDRAAAAGLLQEYLLRRDEPEYQFFPDEIFEALAACFEKELTAALSRVVRTETRIGSLGDLEKILASAGVIVAAEGRPDLVRRIPSGAAMTARRALEWSFGADARLVPDRGKIAVMDTAAALAYWQKRLNTP